jgi:hypothetical protein
MIEICLLAESAHGESQAGQSDHHRAVRGGKPRERCTTMDGILRQVWTIGGQERWQTEHEQKRQFSENEHIATAKI